MLSKTLQCVLRCFVGVSMFAASATPVGAIDYWVSAGGSDGDDGLSPATAWATLQFAADSVVAGDTVHVGAGTYTGFYLDTSGTAPAPIVFLADGPGAVIDSDNPSTPDGINLEGADHVVIDGFTVTGATRAGVRAVLADFVTIRNVTAANNGKWGIFTGFTDDLLVENNETYGAADEHGIYVSNSSDRPTIRDNLIYDNNANGIHLNGDASQGGDGLIEDALIERNVIYGNGVAGGSGINGDGLTNSTIRNNLLYDNHASGISLYRIDASAGASGNVVVNNTIINASDARWCININSASVGNAVLNNITYNHHSFRGAIAIDASSTPGFTSDYNAVMDRFSTDGGNSVVALPTWQAAGYDQNSFVSTPASLFVAPGVDFHLLAPGPAVDAGTSTNAPSTDLDGGARPVGGGYDLGAYEAQLLECGDGDIDPGEQCGEPALVCGDPCTSCVQCVCVLDEPVCGDALVCASEECEIDGDCALGEVCSACSCVNESVCTSGIKLERARTTMNASPYKLRLKGEAVIAKPWLGIDLPLAGVRFVIDHATGPGGVDTTLPGGAAWSAAANGLKWTYKDSTASVGGVKKVVIRDLSAKEDGRLRIVVKATAAMAEIVPGVDSVRTSIVFGGPGECALLGWNGPADARPHCTGSAAKIRCR